MIRSILVVSLSCLLALVLYLPSAYPPERFLAQIRGEDAQIKALWSDERAHRILSLALGITQWNEGSRERTGAAAHYSAPSPGSPASELESASRRALENSYVRSAEALVVLAAYRLSTLLEWTAWLVAMLVAAIADGLVVRAIKAREFRQHDPEVFAVCAGLGCCVGVAILTVAVMPWTVHPLLGPAAVVAMGLSVALAASSFHRR
ncbi:MAG: DUF4400 domain-containing protein [Ideonella sp.]|nr:DUF4400 domain-containing protein [Ideonella sp.]